MLTTTPDGVPTLEPKHLVRRRFVMSLGFVAIVGSIFALVADRGSSDRIIGSGSTFAMPLIQRMAVVYQDAKSGDSDWVTGSAGVDYEPVGSLSGIMRLKDPEVDFAIADYPLSAEAASELGVVQFPIVIGSISPVYNLPEQKEPLRFTAPLLAAVYGGKVAVWSDPAIAAVNPGRTLPDTRIVVVHRADGSGSTLNWTAYLSSGSEEWKAGFGSATTVRWPTGVDVRGGDRMAETVKATPGAIGYLETGQAFAPDFLWAPWRTGSMNSSSRIVSRWKPVRASPDCSAPARRRPQPAHQVRAPIRLSRCRMCF